MQVTGAQAIFGLNASVTADATNVSGAIQLGLSQTQQRFPTASVAYSTRFLIAENSTGSIDLTDNDTSASDAFTAGAAQVETATAVGTITTAGNAEVVFTAADVVGSPITLSVPVLLSDTDAVWAGKVRTALAANTPISDQYAISGTTTAIVATRKPLATVNGVPFYTGSDATLNISLDNDTCAGITTAATSAATVAGTATSGANVIDGDGKDVWGNTITACVPVAMLVECGNGNSVEITNSTETLRTFVGQNRIISSDPALEIAFYEGDDVWTIDALDGVADIKITIIGIPTA